MKLNKKGYMLVEIILASVLAMGVAYYLLNLTYKFQNKDEDTYYETVYIRDKNLITKNIMTDLERGKIRDDSIVFNENENYVTFILETEDEFGNNSVANRKLSITKTDNGVTITYGKIDNEGNFVTTDVSYYQKTLEKSLRVGDIVIKEGNNESDASAVSFLIPVESNYSDESYDIKLIGQKYILVA